MKSKHTATAVNQSFALATSLLALMITPIAYSASLEWTGSTTGLSTGVSNTWDTNTTANWSDGAANVIWPALGGTDDDAVFGGTAGSVTITTATANGITFNAAGYALTGGTLTLNGTTPTINNGRGINATISSVIAGVDGVTKSGTGILNLSGANTYTGNTAITEGTVVAQNNAAFGTNANNISVSSGAALDLGGTMATNGLNQGTRVFTVSGTGVGGTGVLTCTATNTQINAVSKVILGGDSTFGGSQRWDMRNNAPTLDLAGYALTKTGSNYLALVGVAVTPGTGSITINQGELNLTQGTSLGGASSNSVTVNNGGTLGMYQSSSAHAWTLNLNNGSTLRAENSSATTQNVWSGPVAITGDVTLRADAQFQINGDITGTGNLIKNNSGSMTVRGINTYNGTTTINGGTLALDYTTNDSSKLDDASALIFNGGTLSLTGGTHNEIINATTLKANTANSITSGGNVIHLNTITREANATLSINGDNYTTTDNLNDASGTLGTWITVNGKLATNATNSADGSIVAFTDYVYSSDNLDDAALYLNKHIIIDSIQTPTAAIAPQSLTFDTAFANGLSLQGSNSLSTGVIRVTATVGANASTLSGGTLTGPTNGDLIINQQNTNAAGALTIGLSIIDNGATNLVKTGAGRAILTGSHTFSGITTVNAGTLQLGNGTTDGSLDNTSSIALTGTLTYNNINSVTQSVAMSGTGTLNKLGTGSLTLNSASTFSGPTTINGGTLILAHTNAVTNSSSVFISTSTGSGTLHLATDTSAVINRIESSSSNPGSVLSDRATPGAGITHTIPAAWLGANTYTFAAGPNVTSGTAGISLGGINLTSGSAATAVIKPTTAVITVTGPVNIGLNSAAKTLNLDGTSTGNLISGVISNNLNTLSILKTSSSTWELSGANTYTGSTIVRQGTLTLSGARTGTSGEIRVSETAGLSATLNISGGSYSLASAINVGNASTTAATGTVNQTGGSVIFTGTGNQLLLGQNSVGNTGIYNLSGGSITTAANTSRGIMLGVNSNTTASPTAGGTFNLSGTGVLNMTTASGATGNALLQIGRSDTIANNTTNLFNQTGGTANVGILTLGGSTGGSTGVGARLSVTGGTFSANQFTKLSAGNDNTSVITIGGTADVTLPAFPTPRGTSSTATLYFDGGTLKPSASSTAYLGGLTNAYIQNDGSKIDTNGFNITVSQNLLADTLSTGGGFTKAGTGILTMSGSNTYTGNTSIEAGTLSLGNGSTNTGLADAADVSIAASATLNLNYTGSDVIDELTINGVAKAPGIWGSVASGAPNTDPALTGTGTLTVTTGPSASAYDTWASSYGLTGLNAAFDIDHDNDGIANGLEWILGGNPTTNSAGILPVATRNSSGDLVLTFTREEDAIAATTLKVQISTDLNSWSKEATVATGSSGPDTNGVLITIDESASPDAVTITIPAANATAGKVFARLHATKP